MAVKSDLMMIIIKAKELCRYKSALSEVTA